MEDGYFEEKRVERLIQVPGSNESLSKWEPKWHHRIDESYLGIPGYAQQ